jgi:predicted RNA-binding protein with PIN domain
LIISSDKDIQLTAKSHGARVMASREFWDKIHRHLDTKMPASSHQYDNDRELTDKEIQKWLKLFQDKNSQQNEE